MTEFGNIFSDTYQVKALHYSCREVRAGGNKTLTVTHFFTEMSGFRASSGKPMMTYEVVVEEIVVIHDDLLGQAAVYTRTIGISSYYRRGLALGLGLLICWDKG